MPAYPAAYEEFTARRSWRAELRTEAIHVDHARGMPVTMAGRAVVAQTAPPTAVSSWRPGASAEGAPSGPRFLPDIRTADMLACDKIPEGQRSWPRDPEVA